MYCASPSLPIHLANPAFSTDLHNKVKYGISKVECLSWRPHKMQLKAVVAAKLMLYFSRTGLSPSVE